IPKASSVLKQVTEAVYLGLPKTIKISATSDAADIVHGLKRSKDKSLLLGVLMVFVTMSIGDGTS
ncbi:MAG: hypothetical protein ACKO5Q_08095, partial [Microcystaceae cyanobacterium]